MDSILGPLKRNVKLQHKKREMKKRQVYLETKAFSPLSDDIKERQARFASVVSSNQKMYGFGGGSDGY